MSEQERSALGDDFDRMMRQLDGLPDTVRTKPSTHDVQTFIGLAQSWIVTTFRRSERNNEGQVIKTGDTIFVRFVDANGGHRFIIPPEVADAIARQRDSLTTKNRRKAARQAVETRKENRKGRKP